jgi:tagatose 1,6-diphosphate aldolase
VLSRQLAIDQRSALRRLFAKASGRQANDVPAAWLVQFKEKVSQFLTPHASAILLDPEYGLPAAGRAPRTQDFFLRMSKADTTSLFLDACLGCWMISPRGV